MRRYLMRCQWVGKKWWKGFWPTEPTSMQRTPRETHLCTVQRKEMRKTWWNCSVNTAVMNKTIEGYGRSGGKVSQVLARNPKNSLRFLRLLGVEKCVLATDMPHLWCSENMIGMRGSTKMPRLRRFGGTSVDNPYSSCPHPWLKTCSKKSYSQSVRTPTIGLYMSRQGSHTDRVRK
jgi:hypothetical protein